MPAPAIRLTGAVKQAMRTSRPPLPCRTRRKSTSYAGNSFSVTRSATFSTTPISARADRQGNAFDTNDYTKLFKVNVPDLSKSDNESLGRAARGLARAFQSISEELPGPSNKLSRLMMKQCFRFAGIPQPDEMLDEIMAEALKNQESIWDGMRDQYREVPEA